MSGQVLLSLPVFAFADELEAQADLIGSAGKSAASTTADCLALWQGLGAVYSAPEADQALGAFDQINVLGTEAGAVTGLIESALVEFAGEARALKMQAEELMTAAGQVPAAEGDGDAAADAGADSDRAAETARLQSRAAALRAEYEAAESRCAAAIRAAAGLFPGPGYLGSGSFGFTTSVADTVLEHVHRSKLHVRPTVDVTGNLGAGLRLENLPFDLIDGGQRYTRTPSGLLIPSERSLDLNRPPIPMEDFKRPPAELRLDTGAVTPPGWARNAGRGLFVLDVGITVWDTGSTQYNKDLVEHPEWDDSRRALSAGENVAIVGGLSVGGGAAGAALGAKGGAAAGAAIGTFLFPGGGTAAGAVVGGIVGGIGGGIVGSGLGKQAGEKVKEIWDSFWDWP